MRPVRKGSGHRKLNNRHVLYLKRIANGTAVSAPIAWDKFSHKAGTRNTCLEEQLGLCAFSEIVLDDHDLGLHIDHVEPKSVNQSRTFDHGNLLLSAISAEKLKGMSKNEVFGGHYRRDKYLATDLITPLWPDSRRFFHCSSSGEVEPAQGLSIDEVRKARYTIDVLNLNARVLVTRRRVWLEELEKQIDELLAAPDALRWFAEAELCDTGKVLRPFHSAVRERFGLLGEEVMTQRCPSCS